MYLLINLTDINLLSVLVAGISHTVIGLIWFMPKLFGNAWVELTKKDLKPASQWIWAGFTGHLVMALVLAVLVNLAGATTIFGGIAVAFLAWIGFIVTLEIGELIWEKIPFRLFLIRIGNQLVGLSVAGAILAVWR
ncbi:MAG: DUF1761 domain-containing protein [Chloroflexota bacterium]|nr:MAG: DUF1761 domain-containing protein [Chloroflexota bacterium]